MHHDIEAEALRQSHCERKEQPHKCVGVVKISQQGMALDCRICGYTTETLEGVSCIIESA